MLKVLKNYFIFFLLFFILAIKQTISLDFHFTNQTGFNNAINTIKNYANRQYIESLGFYCYDHTKDFSVNDLRGISIVSQCTNLKSFRISIGRVPNSRTDTFNSVVNAVKNLKHLELFQFTCHTCRNSNIGALNTLFLQSKTLTTIQVAFYVNGINDFCNGISNLQDATQLQNFYFSVAYDNKVTSIKCFQNKIKPLVNLEVLSLQFISQKISNINYLKNEFHNLKKVTNLYIGVVNNPVSSFSLQNSFSQMTSLKSLGLDAGPKISSGIRWSNFTIVHDTLEELTLVSNYYITNSHEIYKYLPNLKRANFKVMYEYRYSYLVHMTKQLSVLDYIETFYIWIYALANDSANQVYISGWGSLFNTVKNKIKRFIYSQDAIYRTIDIQNLKNVITSSKLPNLEQIEVAASRYSGASFIAPQFNHPNVKTLYYKIDRVSTIQNYWSKLKYIFNNVPNLENAKLEFISCSLGNSDMTNFHYTLQSLQGKTLRNFELSFWDNQLTNVSNLGNGLQNFNNLIQLHLLFINNKLIDINQFNGIFQNKYQLEDILLHLRGNTIEDQTNLGLVFDDIVYGIKPKIKSIDIDLKHPVNGQNPTIRENMDVEGEYLSISKYGYCYSNFSMARRFVLGSNKCAACINEFCHSCSKPDVCDKCRKSEPQRQLPRCLCNLGFYDGADSSCLQCSRKCKSCDNGQNCLECVNSIPKRIGSDCICPDGYYDDGINDQCGTCKIGSATCSDGMTSNSCVDGYYLFNNQCLLCPAQSSKCEYDFTNQKIKLLQCVGENRLYIPQIDCPCIEGFYQIKFVQNCFACNPICTTCTSFKNCTECLPGFYLQLQKDQTNKTCKKCSPLCKTCSQPITCDSCEYRQLDPSTGCTQKYVYGTQQNQNTDIQGNYSNGSYGDGSTTNGSGSYDSGSYGDGSTTNGSGSYGSGSYGDGSTTNGSGSYGSGTQDNGSTTNGSGSYGSGTQGDSTNGSGNYGSGSYGDGNQTNGSGNYGSGSYGDGNSTNGSGNYGNGAYGDGNTTNGSQANSGQNEQLYQQQYQSQFQQASTASFSMLNPVTNIMEQISCHPECDSCEDQPEKCLTCHIGLNRQNEPPFCGCQEGYYDQVDSYDCLKCGNNCKECRSKNECTLCNDKDFRELDQNRNCSCIKGFKEVKGQSECQQCYQIQEECVFKCPAYTIQDEQNKVCQQINYQFNSSLLKYVICGIIFILASVIIKFIMNKIAFKFKYVQVNKSIKLQKQIQELPDSNSNSDSQNEQQQKSQDNLA